MSLNLDARQRANLAEMAREYALARAVPGDLVEASTRASTRAAGCAKRSVPISISR